MLVVDVVVRCRLIYKDIVVVFKAFCWGSPSQQKISPHHHHVAALMLHSCIYVFAFALAVYWHNSDGMPIAVCQVPRLHHMEVQRPIFIEPTKI